ncbi:MAG TPA: hypothetical protein VHV76_06225 [Mycobacteriales bacterium]|jgi:Flp pilus assembly CpaE family ATPase|nr:hypothetical protein [Mycobacteriales bacterium]
MNVTVLTAIGDPRREAEVAAGLSEIDLGVTVVRRCVDLPDLLAAACAGLAEAAVLSADLRGLDRAAVRRLADAGLVVVGLAPDDRATQDRLRGLGVTDLLTDTSPVEAVAAALVAAASQRHSDRAGRQASVTALGPGHDEPSGESVHGAGGKVVAVWGPAGAPGRSTIALNLAAELATLGHEVLCVDLDTYGASLGQLAGLLDEGSGVAAACRHANGGRLDGTRLRQLAAELRPGLSLLTGISSPQRWPELRSESLEMVLSIAKAGYGFIVLDAGFCLEHDEDLAYDTLAPCRNGATVAAVAAADEVVAIGSADPVGIARLVREVADLPCLTTPITVVNRVRRGVVGRGDPGRQIGLALGRYAGVTDAVMVPEDATTADAAVVAGRTWAEVSASSPARLAVRDLARQIAGSGPVRRRTALRLRKVQGY